MKNLVKAIVLVFLFNVVATSCTQDDAIVQQQEEVLTTGDDGQVEPPREDEDGD